MKFIDLCVSIASAHLAFKNLHAQCVSFTAVICSTVHEPIRLSANISLRRKYKQAELENIAPIINHQK